ncbi:MAG: guanylate kinase [Lachnospiraceae bacterium]|nr:guanylate kinase [Lachnospiraceae bacterium]
MSKIFYLMGKSSTGKDTIYKRIIDKYPDMLKSVVMYTTRPKRDGEMDGVTYNFVTEDEYAGMQRDGLIIEERAYNTVHGLWRYFTAKDRQIDLEHFDYLIAGVLASYVSTREYFGKDVVLPIYVEVEDGVRLTRALEREKKPGNHKYAEMCRRFLSDTEDFSEDKLKAAGIDRRFVNDDLEECIKKIESYIMDKIV